MDTTQENATRQNKTQGHDHLDCAAPPQLRRLNSCPKMRSDLRFVYEDDGSDDVQRLPGLLRINDLPNDHKFDFTAKGHFL